MKKVYYPKSAVMGFFQGTQELVRISHGKRAISVPATEVLLYLVHFFLLDDAFVISAPVVFSDSLTKTTFWTPLRCLSQGIR